MVSSHLEFLFNRNAKVCYITQNSRFLSNRLSQNDNFLDSNLKIRIEESWA